MLKYNLKQKFVIDINLKQNFKKLKVEFSRIKMLK